MRKFLIVLTIIVLASFLMGAGCFTEPEPVDPDKPDVICPVVEVSSEVEIGGKNYIKGGKQEITVTFAVPTELVSVYVGDDLKTFIFPLPGWEVVMYANADKTVYTGDFVFGKETDDCAEAYIYVETCETCDYCKYPYTVDTVGPYANIEITEVTGICPGESYIKFDSTWTEDNGGCPPYAGDCCDDDCSGLASWTIGIYDMSPEDTNFDCCAKLLYSGGGTACPILWTTDCIKEWGDKVFYAIIKLEDVVGNTKKGVANLIMGFDETLLVVGEGCPDN